MYGMMVDPGTFGDLCSSGFMSSLITVGLIREQALPETILVSDTDGSISNPKSAFNLLQRVLLIYP